MTTKENLRTTGSLCQIIKHLIGITRASLVSSFIGVFTVFLPLEVNGTHAICI